MALLPPCWRAAVSALEAGFAAGCSSSEEESDEEDETCLEEALATSVGALDAVATGFASSEEESESEGSAFFADKEEVLAVLFVGTVGNLDTGFTATLALSED